MLTGSVGRTTVQVPFYRLDFPDDNSYWAKTLEKRRRAKDGVILEV